MSRDEPAAVRSIETGLVVDGGVAPNRRVQRQPRFDFRLAPSGRAAVRRDGCQPHDSTGYCGGKQSLHATKASAFTMAGCDDNPKLRHFVQQSQHLAAQIHFSPIAKGRRLQHPVEVQE